VKLIVVAQDFPPVAGGIQEYSYQLALELSSRCQVLALAPTQARARDFDRAQPFTILRLPSGHTSLFGITTPVGLPAACAAIGARVVLHCQWTTAIGSVLAQRLGLIEHYFVAAHGREIITDRLPPAERALRRIALGRAADVFPVSAYTAGLVRRCGVSAARVHPVRNGVDTSLFRPRERQAARQRLGLDGRSVILTTARLVPRKGIDTVLEALERIADRYPDLLYVVVGDGPDRERLQRLAGPLVAQDRVRLTGRVRRAELPDYYTAADVFAMPARQEADGSVEGFGLVFLEAGACGTAVIGARSGGIADAVEDGVNGLLVPPADPPRLAAAIARLLDDEPLRQRLGRQGLTRARSLTWSRCADSILEQIELRVSRGRHRRRD
jgi:phosphatidylinositol alpha-1,6-mannosyltransferase